MLCNSSYRLRVQRRERWRAHKAWLDIGHRDIGPHGSLDCDDVVAVSPGRADLHVRSPINQQPRKHHRSRDQYDRSNR